MINRVRNTIKRIFNTKKFCCVLFGVLFSVYTSMMILSGGDFDGFLSQGNVYNPLVYGSDYLPGCQYDSKSNTNTIAREDVYTDWKLESGFWRNLYFEYETQNVEGLKINICGFMNGQMKWSKYLQTTDGLHEILLPEQQTDRIQMHIPDQMGKVVRIKTLKISMRPQFGDWKAMWALAEVLFVVYLIGFIILDRFHVFEKAAYAIWKIIDFLQETYMHFLEMCAGASCKLSYRSAGRIVLWFLLIVEVLFHGKLGLDEQQQMIIFCILLFLLILLSAAEKEKWKFRRNPLLFWWFCAGMCRCISEFIVGPRNQTMTYSGYILIVLFGLLFVVWNNSEHKKRMLREFQVAYVISFVIMFFICAVFYPLSNEHIRYGGIYRNVDALSICCVLWCACFLSMLEQCATYRKICRKMILKVVVYICCLDISVFFVILTQSRAGFLECGILGLLVLFRIRCAKKDKLFRKKYLLYCVIALLLLYPANKILSLAMSRNVAIAESIAEKNIETILDNVCETKTVIAADVFSQANNVQQSFQRMIWRLQNSNGINDYSSGRIGIYKEYLKNMNLWGHNTWLMINGELVRPHNDFLSIAYQYGIFSVIPYIMMVVSGLKCAWRYMKSGVQKGKNCLWPVLNLGIITIMMMFDYVELGVEMIPWLLYNLTIGYLIINEREKKERSYAGICAKREEKTIIC